jgi:hypothetical protein
MSGMTHPLFLAPARLMSSVENQRRAYVTKYCAVDCKLKRKPIIPPSFTEPKASILYGAQNANVEEERIETVAFAHSRRTTFTHVHAFSIKEAIVENSSKFQSQTGNVHQAPFDQIMNGEPFQKLRRELLTGELRKVCQECPSRSVTTPDALLNRLRATKGTPRA